MIPPLITVGSSCAVSSSAPIIEVVVVLPWVPAIASDHLSRISSPSISARRTTGRRRTRAAMISGLSGLTAEEITTTSAAPRFSASWPTATGMPSSMQPPNIGAVGQVAALHLIAEIVQYLGDAAHADAADADEMHAARSIERQRSHAARPCGRDAGLELDGEPWQDRAAASRRPKPAARCAAARQCRRRRRADLRDEARRAYPGAAPAAQ